jgi:hypothetical protein
VGGPIFLVLVLRSEFCLPAAGSPGNAIAPVRGACTTNMCNWMAKAKSSKFNLTLPAETMNMKNLARAMANFKEKKSANPDRERCDFAPLMMHRMPSQMTPLGHATTLQLVQKEKAARVSGGFPFKLPRPADSIPSSYLRIKVVELLAAHPAEQCTGGAKQARAKHQQAAGLGNRRRTRY